LAVWQLEADAALIDVSHLKCFFSPYLHILFGVVSGVDWLSAGTVGGDRRSEMEDRGSWLGA